MCDTRSARNGREGKKVKEGKEREEREREGLGPPRGQRSRSTAPTERREGSTNSDATHGSKCSQSTLYALDGILRAARSFEIRFIAE